MMDPKGIGVVFKQASADAPAAISIGGLFQVRVKSDTVVSAVDFLERKKKRI